MISGSTIERVLACPASEVLPHVRKPASSAAERGTAVHLYLERVRDGMKPDDALDLIEDQEHRSLCAAIVLDRLPQNIAPEVALAYDVAYGTARELGRRMGRAYTGLSATEIPLTLDALGLTTEHVFVGDYKTGYHVTPARSNAQLALGGLAAARCYDRESALVEVIRIRPDGDPWRDHALLDSVDLDDFAQRVADAFAEVGAMREVRPLEWDVAEGEHCRWCPAWDSCPAKAATLVRVATGDALSPIASLVPLTPEMAGHAYLRVKEAGKLLDRIHAAVQAALTEYGELPLPNGNVLRRVTEPGNQRLDGRLAFEVVRDLMDVDVATASVEIKASQAGIERALKAAADAGKIGPRARAETKRLIMAKLQERGGITRPMVQRLNEAPGPPGQLKDSDEP